MPDVPPAASPSDPATRPDQGEQHDVTRIHAALLREQPEPRDGFEPVNLWLVALTGALLFWGGYYLANFSGRFEADEYSEFPRGQVAVAAAAETPEQQLARVGAQVYNYCAPCHQSAGQGVAGQFPPLAGSDWVNVDGNARLIRIVLHGLSGPISVNGNTYNNAMNQFGDVLSDGEIAAVLTFVRNSWGNQGGVVTVDEVRAVRAETSARDIAWSAEELLAIPATGAGGAAPVPVGIPDLPQLLEWLKALPQEELQTLLQQLPAD
ncbi:MAG: cytochrome c [Verrucomicrobiae bacterium]|nr:cytochrome c [Verrucomicrobiae bacterium]